MVIFQTCRLEDVKDEGISAREASVEPTTGGKSEKILLPSSTEEERAHSHKHPSDAALASTEQVSTDRLLLRPMSAVR